MHFTELDEFLHASYTRALKRLGNLKSVEIHAAQGGVQDFDDTITLLEEDFERWFGGRNDGWTCPEIKLVDLECGFVIGRDHLSRTDIGTRD